MNHLRIRRFCSCRRARIAAVSSSRATLAFLRLTVMESRWAKGGLHTITTPPIFRLDASSFNSTHITRITSVATPTIVALEQNSASQLVLDAASLEKGNQAEKATAEMAMFDPRVSVDWILARIDVSRGVMARCRSRTTMYYFATACTTNPRENLITFAYRLTVSFVPNSHETAEKRGDQRKVVTAS